MYNEKNYYSIHGIPVLEDNIVWIWIRKNEALVIDPSLAKPVKEWLDERSLKLVGILQTHHHDDHIGGTKSLLDSWPKAVVVASKGDIKRIPFQTISVTNNQELYLMGSNIRILNVAGHTRFHLAYYVPAQEGISSKPMLFCGDTLFGAGCGRVLEGTKEQLYQSLRLLNKLPQDTRIYCAHEYTEANLRWATSIYPNDIQIRHRLEKIINKRQNGILSLPSILKEERETNLFLRAKSIEEFTKLRVHKDNWKV